MMIGNHTRMMSHQSALTQDFFNSIAGGAADSEKRRTLEALGQHGDMNHEHGRMLSNEYVDHVLALSSQGVARLTGKKDSASIQDLPTVVGECSRLYDPDDASNKKYTEYLESVPGGVPDSVDYDRPQGKLGTKFAV